MCCVLWTRSIVAQNSPPWLQRPSRTHTHTHTHATQAHHRPRRTVHLAIPCYTLLYYPATPQCTPVYRGIMHHGGHPCSSPFARHTPRRVHTPVILCHTLSYSVILYRTPPAIPTPTHPTPPTKLHLFISVPSPPLALPGTPIHPRARAPAADRSAPTYSAEAGDGTRGAEAGSRAREGSRSTEVDRGPLRMRGAQPAPTRPLQQLAGKMRIQVGGARTPARRKPASQSPFLLARSLARPPARPQQIFAGAALGLSSPSGSPRRLTYGPSPTLREGAPLRRPRAPRSRASR